MTHRTRTSRMRRLAVAGILMVTLLSLASCGRAPAINHQSAATTATSTIPSTPTIPPTPAPTFTPAPPRALSWHTRTAPTPLSSTYGALSLGFSPVDNSLLWACAPQGSAAQIWLSHDRAATWQPVTDVVAEGEVDACSVIPDDLDPTTAVVQTDLLQKGCCVLPPIPYPLRITRDSGRTWAIFHGPDDTLRQITTYHGSAYALFSHHFEDMAPFTSAFVVSSDGLRTWQPMDSKLATPNVNAISGGYVRQFWVNPATGAMLAQTATSVVWTDHFLSSSDGGANWRDLRAPQADDFVVQTPFTAGPWEICGVRRSNSSAHPSWNNTMPCTLDGGATWRTRTIIPIPEAFAIANDGSVLGITGSRLIRLTPNGRDWQSLGPLNTNWMPPNAYVAGSGVGVIWNVPASNGPSSSATIYFASYA